MIHRNGLDEIWLRTREDRSVDRPLITQRDFGDDRTIMLSSPSFSPDGQRIAYQRNAQKPIWPLRIWISSTAGGPPVPLLPATHEGYQGAPSWSPDGQWIAYTEWKQREWMLVKVRVGSGGRGHAPDRRRSERESALVAAKRLDHVGDRTGPVLVSPDGGRATARRPVAAHTWSRDGSDVFGIREREPATCSCRQCGQQKPGCLPTSSSPPVNNPVKDSVWTSGSNDCDVDGWLRGDLWLTAWVAVVPAMMAAVPVPCSHTIPTSPALTANARCRLLWVSYVFRRLFS